MIEDKAKQRWLVTISVSHHITTVDTLEIDIHPLEYLNVRRSRVDFGTRVCLLMAIEVPDGMPELVR